jgi:hypothetical protein
MKADEHGTPEEKTRFAAGWTPAPGLAAALTGHVCANCDWFGQDGDVRPAYCYALECDTLPGAMCDHHEPKVEDIAQADPYAAVAALNQLDGGTLPQEYGWSSITVGPDRCGTCTRFGGHYCTLHHLATTAASTCRAYEPTTITENTMARKPTETELTEHIVTDADTPDLPALREANNAVAAADAVILAGMDAMKMVGRIEMADFVATVAEKAIAETYLKIKETKSYKGLPYRKDNGEMATVATLDEFCEAYLHKSSRRCRELAANYHLLGPQLYEHAERIGLGQRDYNAIKALPADDQAVIKAAIEAEDRSRVIDLMQEMAVKHGAEKEQAKQRAAADQATIEDLRGSLDASRSRVKEKDEEINALKDKLYAKQRKATPELVEAAALDDLHVVTKSCVTQVSAELRRAIVAILDIAEGRPGNTAHLRLVAEQALGQVVCAARDLAADLNLVPAENPGSVFPEAAGDDERAIWDQINAELEERNDEQEG